MRVISKQTLIATVAERFRADHQRRGEWQPTAEGGDASAIYTQLMAFSHAPTEETITAAIGDNRWTENICDECGEDREITIILAEEIHHPTDAVAICPTCLKQAARLASASE
jgi:hypothetical protein